MLSPVVAASSRLRKALIPSTTDAQLSRLHATGRDDAATADEEHVLDRHAEHVPQRYSRNPAQWRIRLSRLGTQCEAGHLTLGRPA
jgi:hypothetical protein